MEEQDDGETLKTHLESLFKQTGIMPEQLAEAPGLPASCQHVWNAFVELHYERRNGERIKLADVINWTQTIGMPIEPWELSAIRRLDVIWLKAQNEHRRSNPSLSG